MISYRREPSHDYTMRGACGVLFEGEIHFFGGKGRSFGRQTQKLDENQFHKRLRNELIMLPIPKAKFFDRKVPSGVNREDFKMEIIEKQSHVLQCAISRVKTSKIIYFKN